MQRLELIHGGFVDYEPSFLSPIEANQWYEFLRENVLWEQKQYSWSGKKVFQPRLTAWYADDENMKYSYSGITQKVQPWMPELLELKQKIEAVSGAEYNSVLLNYYRDGNDSVAFHADDEKELGDNPNIASLSLGATRTFTLLKNGAPDVYKDYDLTNGSLLIMGGTTQRHWKHSIPKQPEITEGRINLTFRKFFPRV